MTTKSNTDLYNLFFTKNLVSIEKNPQNSSPQSRFSPATAILTPMSKLIYDQTSPRSKPYILKELKLNNQTIKTLESQSDESDLDFNEKMENNGLGFFMENFISAEGYCPVCGMKTLRKYAFSNIPCVDFVCINKQYHLENEKCFLFQLKISTQTNYFNLRSKTITVGSKQYGEKAHKHLGTENILSKIIMPGYICIKMVDTQTAIQTYHIDHRNSFVLVPDYQNTFPNLYYSYLPHSSFFNKPLITWNTSMVETLPLKKVIGNTKVSNTVYNEVLLQNPYADLIKLL